jgi:hypothetical protein
VLVTRAVKVTVDRQSRIEKQLQANKIAALSLQPVKQGGLATALFVFTADAGPQVPGPPAVTVEIEVVVVSVDVCVAVQTTVVVLWRVSKSLCKGRKKIYVVILIVDVGTVLVVVLTINGQKVNIT